MSKIEFVPEYVVQRDTYILIRNKDIIVDLVWNEDTLMWEGRVGAKGAHLFGHFSSTTGYPDQSAREDAAAYIMSKLYSVLQG